MKINCLFINISQMNKQINNLINNYKSLIFLFFYSLTNLKKAYFVFFVNDLYSA